MSTISEAAASGSLTEAESPVVPAIIRGRVVTDSLIEFAGRGGSTTFRTPDPRQYARQLPLASPAQQADLYDLSFDDILDYLEGLGSRLDIATNEHLRWARSLTYATAHATKPLIDNAFRGLARRFSRDAVREMADCTVGLDYLNGWVDTPLHNGTTVSVRAFGARTLHIIPGNSVGAAAGTLIKNAFTRSDAIIKTPSNNPFVAVALGLTMCEYAPDHPMTRHVSIAYWRGGDEEVERTICQPHNIEKIIAWGGLASVRHVTRYIQPGLELISLDPKYSCSVIDLSSVSSDDDLRQVAVRLAVDVGTGNQEPCSASRVAYAITGGRPDGVELANRLGTYVYEELLGLPAGLTTKPKTYDAELRSNVDSLRLQEEFYNVIGGEDDEGAVVVSQLPDPIDFVGLLQDRTVNIVPLDSLQDVLGYLDAYTQTVGVYPESLKEQLLDVAPLYGVQRFVSLGYSSEHTGRAPHDGLELERRMCKWIVDQRSQPARATYASSRPDSGEASAEADASPVVPQTLDAVIAATTPDGER
ncbi:acyl-CoA reductase [Dactylosporangium sp. NPDC051485]|uniref:acyl-CoA reductase n=1 Tax=Dactylosporangium sp. NPDC051485 TaxID=3154846 RepID=UPI003438D8B5